MPRVLVIEHQRNAGLGRLEGPIRESGVEIVTVGPDREMPVPESLAGYDGLIVLGGSMGPTDDESAPWLPAVRTLLNEGVDGKLPTLGICLGAQLMTVARGGVVEQMERPPELGVQTVHFVEDSSEPGTADLFGPLAGLSVPAMQWHYLEARTLPAEARVRALNEACPHQAFSIGDAAWGVQFHPEAAASAATEWTLEDPEGLELVGISADDVIAAARDSEPQLVETWEAFGARFGEIVRNSALTRSTSL